MSKPILMVPNATGSGHNMRALALASELRSVCPEREIVVLLGSMQDVFAPLFESAGVKVISTENDVISHAHSSHLDKILDQEHYISGYLAPTFLNGSKIIDYLAYFKEINPAIVVSDYNLTASVASVIGQYRHVLITERYDFSLAQISNDDFREAGFIVNDTEISRARPTLSIIFDWIIRNSSLVLTDKPPLPDLDVGTALYSQLNEPNVHFVGPMTRPAPKNVNQEQLRHELGLSTGPLLVASVGGMSMFIENKQKAIRTYLHAFAHLRKSHSDAEMILIGRGTTPPAEEGVHTLNYIPDWMPLLTCATALIAQPGWITVTEVAALRVPTIFVLGGRGEYHEIESLRRLEALGFPTLVEPSPDALHSLLKDAVTGQLADRCAKAFATLTPSGGRATLTAAKMISQVTP
ncbi:hypothetical protein [Actinomyces lilanjuaniae]|uniref:hypothetical protein n=1 Tax=Actinomyces lilanjuaniae TaxID=2321394 RepID=UPI0013C4444F|nr:hypothetical protein [Actinomyces lilanjuaniae]